ncbi:hypothetical protein J4417_00055 [Candidatus Woesearchaeota archaeon]|nr:hypothetical protein [Candidatus Woesearchaeota archaeon]
MPNSLSIEEILEKAMQDGHFQKASLFYPKHSHLDKEQEVVLLVHTARPEQPTNYLFTYCTKNGFLLSLPEMVKTRREIVLVCPYITYKSATEAEEIYRTQRDIKQVRAFLSS